jgi:hypothetical protein
MIRREHIKQAIDAVSKMNPEIGYSLDELLGTGLIDADPESGESSGGEDFHFLFQGQRVLVNRVLFFQEGTPPIEQGLLIKYGEMVKRQEIQERGESLEYAAALREIHEAGLRLAVHYELDYAAARLKKRISSRGSREEEGDPENVLIDLLQRIKREDAVLCVGDGPSEPDYLYKGALDDSTPALLMCFPFCSGSLMQVADLNLDFFHLRFVVGCLVRGLEKDLLACVVRNRIVGLVFLAPKEKFLRRDLEIKYIATQRRRSQESAAPPPPVKGVGTFLVAGIWMLVKNEIKGSGDIVLDSEIGARRFYASVGFQPRGFSGFVLRKVRPGLLRALLSIARNHPELPQRTVDEIASMIKRQVKGLRKRPATEKAIAERKVVIACVQECLLPGSRLEFLDAALQGLLKYRGKILESEELIRYASERGFNRESAHGRAAGTSR